MESHGQAGEHAEKVVSDLSLELRTYLLRPPGGDIRISAYAEGLLDAMADVPHVKEQIAGLVGRREKHFPGRTSPSYYAMLILRGMHRTFFDLQRDVTRGLEDSIRVERLCQLAKVFPEEFNSPQNWKDSFTLLLMPETNRKSDLLLRRFGQLEFIDVVSNVTQRYKTLPIINEIYGERWGHRPTVMDIGTSGMLGLKHLVSEPFSPVSAYTSEESGQIRWLAEEEKAINEPLRSPMEVEMAYGVDAAFPPGKDRYWDLWREACSSYTSELLDRERTERFRRLEAADFPHVKFVWSNVASPPDSGLLEAGVDRESTDIAFVSTTFYQFTAIGRAVATERIKRTLKPGGVLVLQDFVREDQRSEGGVYFYRNWFQERFRYRTLVLDPATDSKRFKEFFRWDNGRCNEIWIPEGSLALNHFRRKAQMNRDTRSA